MLRRWKRLPVNYTDVARWMRRLAGTSAETGSGDQVSIATEYDQGDACGVCLCARLGACVIVFAGGVGCHSGRIALMGVADKPPLIWVRRCERPAKIIGDGCHFPLALGHR